MNYLNALLFFALMLGFGTTTLNAQNVNIPDANFKAYLLGNTIINANGDSEIQITEAANYTSSMNCYSLNISDLTGIEAFTNLDALNCALNNLTSLDLSQNTSLTEVICESNNLTSLILPTTGNLFTIECRFNQITTLDLSQVNNVSFLNAEGSGLYNLDLRNGNNGYLTNAYFNVTNNPNLSCVNVDDVAYSTANWTNIDAGTVFSTNCIAPPALVNIPNANFKAYLVGNTAINTNGNTEIEVSEATAFGGTIDCSNQNIVELTGIEEFVNLTALNCSSNNLTSLDLTQNTSLTSLDCNSNNLSSLEVKNNNNTNFTAFDATNNSGLSCIEVDAVAYSTTNWTNIDAGTSFSTNCVPPVVNIPDANFKTNLLNNAAINTNGDGEIQVTEATAFTGTINCSSTNLINVTGLEAFVNLTGLICTNNAQLLSLDVSQNVNLLTLNCSNNYQLGSLSANNNLQTLTCTGTDLYGIFLRNITGLVTLNCSGNNIANLDVSQNTNLVNLNCSGLSITTLDLSNNPNLEVFQCDFNNLTSLDIRNGNNTIITNFQVNFGSLSCVDVDNVAYSTTNWTNVDAGTSFSTNCSGPPIVNIPDVAFKAYLVGNTAINTNGDTEIQVTEATAFNGTINCTNLNVNLLTGIEAFTSLTALNCSSNNGILDVDVSQNAALTTLICSNCAQIGFVNVTQNANLTTLDCSGTDLYGINVTQNTNLVTFNCQSSRLTSLDLRQNTNLVNLNCALIDITTLDLTQNVNLETFDGSFNSLTSLDLRNGNNTSITSFNSTFNSSLTCIGVDDVVYSTANWTNIDGASSFSINCAGPAPVVNIPDANFKAYLVGNTAINTNGDSEIQVTEATAFTGTITCNSLAIADMTGVEAFVNLGQLRCHNNNITSLDVTQNTSLTHLYCYNNNLTNLDLNQNANLVVLHCVGNSISNLDLSQNANLSLVFCTNNPISTLDMTQNTNLTKLYCASTQLSSLDLSQNTSLTVLDCASTQLSSLNVKNGNNANVTTFKALNNPNLSCIEVDNATYSTANWTNIDATTSFSTNCTGNPLIVYIPDANFKAYLVGNTAINTNGDSEIQVTEATAFAGTITCNSLAIADMTGVEAFVNLGQLRCHNNNITSLDVTQNTSLTQLHCYSNNINSLDVTQNTNLTFLHCVNNNISNLDVSQNTDLTRLYCSSNPISSLNLSQNRDLGRLYCGSTQLTSLDVSQNTNLEILDCSSAQLTSLDVRNGNNTSIGTFKALNNPNLTCIDVDNVAYSTANWTNIDAATAFSTNCSSVPPIVTIPDANFKAYLVANNAINTNGDAEIQVSEALAFNGTIACSSLNIADLTGLEAFVNLMTLDCSANNISSLDVSQNTSLVLLDCAANNISDLDLTQNVNLTRLHASNNNLVSLDIRNGNNTIITTFDALNNPSLACITVDDIAYSTANWMDIDATASFNTVCGLPIVYIPDANFKAYLLSNSLINTNGDTEIQVTEATAFTGKIKCPNLNIADLTGVEAFVNLTTLVCYKNNLTSLDVSQNTSLTFLHCVNNSLNNLDVSQNTSLTRLYCSNNPLTSLDVSQNTSLQRLYTSTTQLSSLDLTQNTNLTILDCSYSLLSSLNVRNGNNTNVTTFKAINNPNLTCIDVDDVAYSTANWMGIDGIASFSTNCSLLVPMANNTNANLVGNVVTNKERALTTQVSETSTSNGIINLSAYPNPTTKGITLDFGKVYQEANIQVINLTGQIVLSQQVENVSNTRLEIEGSTGIYFVTIQTKAGTATLKVIKE